MGYSFVKKRCRKASPHFDWERRECLFMVFVYCGEYLKDSSQVKWLWGNCFSQTLSQRPHSTFKQCGWESGHCLACQGRENSTLQPGVGMRLRSCCKRGRGSVWWCWRWVSSPGTRRAGEVKRGRSSGRSPFFEDQAEQHPPYLPLRQQNARFAQDLLWLLC